MEKEIKEEKAGEKELESRILEIRLLENQIMQLEQQMALLDQQIMELQALQADLDAIKNAKQQEIFAPLGRDIFIRSKLESVDSVLLNVGARVMVKKDIAGAKATLEKQRRRLLDVRGELSREMDNILERAMGIEEEIKSLKS